MSKILRPQIGMQSKKPGGMPLKRKGFFDNMHVYYGPEWDQDKPTEEEQVIKTPLDEISELVEAMKGELEISFSHYSGWHASCQTKGRTKTWTAHSPITNSYDIEWFSSANEAILTLLNKIKEE